MSRTAAAQALAALLLLAGPAAAQRAPVIVELFTSEGCSSCPPADAVLSRLEREQPISSADVIVLSEHVDYWNDGGWQDRFSSPLFTSRQQDYGQALRLREVFTPQMLVNGQTSVIGSDWSAATQAIRAASQQDGRAEVRVSSRGRDAVAIEVNHLPADTRSADMLLAITESGLESSVFGGENNGRRLRHTGVVRSLTSLGKIDSKRAYSAEARLNVKQEWNRNNLKVVLFVQDRNTRRILGASTMRLY
jgi:hypothetical protein